MQKLKKIFEDTKSLSKYRFLLFIVSSILLSFVVVMISMELYQSSGAAQLDLSRPGYVSVRSQATTDTGEFQNYPDSGPINQDDINEFKAIYDLQAQKIKTVDAFKGDPLSIDALGINTVNITE